VYKEMKVRPHEVEVCHKPRRRQIHIPWTEEDKVRTRAFAEQSRLPRLIKGWIVLALDPAVHHTGLAWYLGGNMAKTGTIRSEAFPSVELETRLRRLLAGWRRGGPRNKQVTGVAIVVEGTEAQHTNNRVTDLVQSVFAVLPQGSIVMYVPPSTWQKTLLGEGKDSTKERARTFAEQAPEIKWTAKRSEQWKIKGEDDASDAACLLFYALTQKPLPPGLADDSFVTGISARVRVE